MNYKRLEFFVFVSNECNLGCSYCSVLNNHKNTFPKEPVYTPENLKKNIESTGNNFNITNIDIYFFGGEPTLNNNFIEEVIKELKTLTHFKIRFILHTNGLLLNTVNKFILSNLSSVVVSINYEKIPSNNLEKSYFGQLINNVGSVKEMFDISLMARLTITENVSLFTNVIQISNFFDYVYWQIQNCIKFKDFNNFFSNYKYELNLLWDYWFNFLKQNVILNFLPFIIPILLKDNSKPSNHRYYCGYNDFMIYVQTDGSCYSCAEEIFDNEYFKIGHINTGISFKKKLPKYIINNCYICEYYTWCMGRCGRMQERFSEVHINEYCLLNKELFKIIKQNKYLKQYCLAKSFI